MFGQLFQGLVEGVKTLGWFAPQNVLAITQRQNSLDSIHAQFKMQELGQEFNAALEAVRQNHNKEIEQYRQYCEDVRLQKRLDSEREQLTRRLQHEEKLESYRRETQLILAYYQLQTALALSDDKEVREKFPLKTPAPVILAPYNSHSPNMPIPLLVIISPPGLEMEKFPNASNGFNRIESTLIDEIQDFCKHYPVHSTERPIQYQGADWESKYAHGTSAIATLHYRLKAVPTLVIESKVDGDLIRIYVATWNIMDKTPRYEKVLTFNWKDVLYPVARKYASEWRTYRLTLLDKGRSLEEISRRGGDDEINLRILEEEEEDISAGRTGEYDYAYVVNKDKYIKELSQFLGICHCILVGVAADYYHFSQSNTSPKLPELLPGLLDKISEDSLKELLIKTIVDSYQSLVQSVESDRLHSLPNLFLDLALSLSHLPDKVWARQQVEKSVQAWLKQRELGAANDLKSLLNALESNLTIEDVAYVQKLNECLTAIGYNRSTSVMDAYFKRGKNYYERSEYQAAIAEFDKAIQLNPQWAEAYYHRGLAYAQLRQYSQAVADYEQVLKINPHFAEAAKKRDIAQKAWEEEESLLKSSCGMDYRPLRDYLAAGQWQKADEETARVMLKVAGREGEGWLDSNSIENFPCEDLRTIDQLWVQYSKGRFGFSVQKRIYQEVGGSGSAVADRVGWRVGGSWLSYSQLTFSDGAKEGHLPAPPYGRFLPFGPGRVGVFVCLFSRAQTCKL